MESLRRCAADPVEAKVTTRVSVVSMVGAQDSIVLPHGTFQRVGSGKSGPGPPSEDTQRGFTGVLVAFGSTATPSPERRAGRGGRRRTPMTGTGMDRAARSSPRPLRHRLRPSTRHGGGRHRRHRRRRLAARLLRGRPCEDAGGRALHGGIRPLPGGGPKLGTTRDSGRSPGQRDRRRSPTRGSGGIRPRDPPTTPTAPRPGSDPSRGVRPPAPAGTRRHPSASAGISGGRCRGWSPPGPARPRRPRVRGREPGACARRRWPPQPSPPQPPVLSSAPPR